MSEKWVPFRTDLILGKRRKKKRKKERGEKSHTGPDRGNIWDVPKLQRLFLRETDEYSGLCEHERYRDGAPMRGLPKGSDSCHALILQGAEKSLFISNSYTKAKQ